MTSTHTKKTPSPSCSPPSSIMNEGHIWHSLPRPLSRTHARGNCAQLDTSFIPQHQRHRVLFQPVGWVLSFTLHSCSFFLPDIKSGEQSEDNHPSDLCLKKKRKSKFSQDGFCPRGIWVEGKWTPPATNPSPPEITLPASALGWWQHLLFLSLLMWEAERKAVEGWLFLSFFLQGAE